ncbi:hypothetical protein BJY52DRAFT_1226998 [Lactarius psammicola]|nr:hypothetical protein BJY52DRAFT_1226998 [Lactarius psammicola]
MESQWTIPHAYPQHRHVTPPTAERPGPIFQPNAPTPGQAANATTPNCSCPWCSDVQRRPPTWYSVEQQHPRHFDNAVVPYVNQGQAVDNPVETALIEPHRMREQWVDPQAVGIQDNFSYASVRERAGPSNARLLQAPTLDVSIAEGRRRLAGHYLNNPDAYVSVIRLEPGAFGQFQVIITLEMANIL